MVRLAKETHTNDLIVQYLLGSLSEEETERLDELGIVDDEFAARLQLVENDLVDAYVSGELSGNTLERFTSFYLSSSMRREKVRFAQVFQATPVRGVIPPQAETGRGRRAEASRTFSRPGGFFGARRPALLWGAASIALLLAVAGLVAENRRLHIQVEQAQVERGSIEQRERDLQTDLERQQSEAADKEREMESLRDKIARLDRPGSSEPAGGRSSVPPERLVAVPVDLSPQTRGISRLTTVFIPEAADLVIMQLELESADYNLYRAEVKSLSGGQAVWSGGRLRPRAKDGGKAVVVNVPAGLFKSQRYIIEVSGISASGAAEIVSSYPFEVKRK